MNSRKLPCLMLAIAAMLPFAAQAKDPVPPPGDWKSIARSAGQEAFVDMGSIEAVDAGLKAAVKFNYSTPQTFGKKTYQSVRNVYIIECASRRLADRENVIYPGLDLSGKSISRASRKGKNLIWRDAPVASVDGELLTYVCKQGAAPAVPAKK